MDRLSDTPSRRAVDAPRRLANLRDLGGLPAGSRQTRSGVLLRSDAPYAADETPEGLAWPPRLVLDLRSNGELSEPHPLAGVADVRSLSLSPDASTDRIAAAHPDLATLYLSIVLSRRHILVEGVRLLSAADGPTLVHCAAGKDRTGLLISIVLSAVGVERDAVLDDYARTGDNMPAVLERLSGAPGLVDDLAELLAARPEYFEASRSVMKQVLEQVDADFGGSRSWLLAGGLAERELERLERRLLV